MLARLPNRAMMKFGFNHVAGLGIRAQSPAWITTIVIGIAEYLADNQDHPHNSFETIGLTFNNAINTSGRICSPCQAKVRHSPKSP